MSRPPSRNLEKAPHAQVGMLMRAYRESFPREDGRHGITQGELLRRMAAVDKRYDLRSSHGTVSRWESGKTTPTVQRLVVFGKALNLTESEVQGLILIAGLDPKQQETRTLHCTRCNGETETAHIDKIHQTPRSDTSVRAAIRTRRCLACGHHAQSIERWAEDPEETGHKHLGHVFQRIGRANDEIRDALHDAGRTHHLRPVRESQSPVLPSGNDHPA